MFGQVGSQNSSNSQGEYADALGDELELIRKYWKKVMNERRMATSDESFLENDREVVLQNGQACIRVCYISGKRHLINKRCFVVRRVGINTYSIKWTDEDGQRRQGTSQGYQLVPILDARNDREGFLD